MVCEHVMNTRQPRETGRDFGHESHVIEWFHRLGPPEFEDTLNPIVTKAWILQLEEIFEMIGCTDKKNVSFTSFMLSGEAKHWWRVTNNILPLEDEEPITWATFMGGFRENYLLESM